MKCEWLWVVIMTCPNCGRTMTQGAPHDESYVSQWECHGCGHIEPVYRSDLE